MPSGVYVRTKPSWSKGPTKETDKRLMETSKKVSNTLRGHVVSEETKEKLHEANKGHKPWNTGLTKETDKRLANAKSDTEKRRNSQLKRWDSGERKRLSKIQIESWKDLQRRKDASKTLKKSWDKNPERRKKMSERMRGENSPSWQGGISFEPYSKKFNKELKELIRNRDGYKCQLCGLPECESIEKLSIHHIDYNKKNNLPSNLITLCRRCNSKVNQNRDEWEIYFKKKIEKIMSQNKIQLNFNFNTEKEGSKVSEKSF